MLRPATSFFVDLVERGTPKPRLIERQTFSRADDVSVFVSTRQRELSDGEFIVVTRHLLGAAG